MQQLLLDISHPNHFDTPPEKVAFDKKINQIQPKDGSLQK